MNYYGKFTTDQYNQEQQQTLSELHHAIDEINRLKKEFEMHQMIFEGKQSYQLMHVISEYQKYVYPSSSTKIVIPSNDLFTVNHTSIVPGIGLNLSRMPKSNQVWCPILDQDDVFDENEQQLNDRVEVTVTNSHPAQMIYETDKHFAWGKKMNGKHMPFIQIFEFDATQSIEAVSMTWTIQFLNQYKMMPSANALFIEPFAVGFNLISAIRYRKQGVWNTLDESSYSFLQHGMPGWVHLPDGMIEQLQIEAKCFLPIVKQQKKRFYLGFEQIRLYDFTFGTTGKIGLRFDLPAIEGMNQIRPIKPDDSITFELFRKTDSDFIKVETLNWGDFFEASTWAVIAHVENLEPKEFHFEGVYLDVNAAGG